MTARPSTPEAPVTITFMAELRGKTGTWDGAREGLGCRKEERKARSATTSPRASAAFVTPREVPTSASRCTHQSREDVGPEPWCMQGGSASRSKGRDEMTVEGGQLAARGQPLLCATPSATFPSVPTKQEQHERKAGSQIVPCVASSSARRASLCDGPVASPGAFPRALVRRLADLLLPNSPLPNPFPLCRVGSWPRSNALVAFGAQRSSYRANGHQGRREQAMVQSKT